MGSPLDSFPSSSDIDSEWVKVTIVMEAHEVQPSPEPDGRVAPQDPHLPPIHSDLESASDSSDLISSPSGKRLNKNRRLLIVVFGIVLIASLILFISIGIFFYPGRTTPEKEQPQPFATCDECTDAFGIIKTRIHINEATCTGATSWPELWKRICKKLIPVAEYLGKHPSVDARMACIVTKRCISPHDNQ